MILNVDEVIPGKSVIQHDSDIPGFYASQLLAFEKTKNEEPSKFLYEQRKGTKGLGHSSFLNEGYARLPPVCDINIIANRQKVIQEFLLDQDQKMYFPILNLMHLMNEWTLIDRRYFHGIPSLSCSAKFLNRYLDEADKLLGLLKNRGAFLEKLVSDIDSRIKREDIGFLEKACNKGEFDSIVVTKTAQGDLDFTGVVGDNGPKNVHHKPLGRFSLYELTGGWTQQELVWAGFKKGLGMLNDIFSPLAALYFEAAYMRRRQSEGKLVCLPDLNSEGKFDLEDGEPIMPTPNPIPRSFSFDRVDARSILNGLHSAGKTHLLLDIPLYIIRAQRGFPNPARRNNVPLTKRIFHSIEIEKRSGGGSLHSELLERAYEISNAKEGDLFLIDEFLQHASPDAAEPLEPIILDAYARTKGTFIIVDHRGESIEDGKDWQFWSPEYMQTSDGNIKPTFRFKRGKPSSEILMKHGKQLIRKVVDEINRPEPKPKDEYESRRSIFEYGSQGEGSFDFASRIEKRVLGGEY